MIRTCCLGKNLTEIPLGRQGKETTILGGVRLDCSSQIVQGSSLGMRWGLQVVGNYWRLTAFRRNPDKPLQ